MSNQLPSSPTNPNSESAQPMRRNKKPKRPRRLLISLGITLLVLLAAMLAWMYIPVLNEIVSGTPTLPPAPPTITSSPTQTATVTPTNTPVPSPSPTPLPVSAYRIEPDRIYPPVPGAALDAVILNEDISVSVDPPFDHPQWYSAEQISQQIGMVIPEPFFATIGPGAATWSMDVPLQPGLYEIFVLDTVYSSGGTLDFQVFLGVNELTPKLGIQHIEYNTLSGIPAQLDDVWHSIGLYELTDIDLLSVHTQWEAREMASIVAIDRILIVHQSSSNLQLLSQLPVNSPKFVVDDSAAAIDSKAIWFTRNDLTSWSDQFQMIVNPEENSQITWQIPNRVPPGYYDIWVYAPAMQGDADRALDAGCNDYLTKPVNDNLLFSLIDKYFG